MIAQFDDRVLSLIEIAVDLEPSKREPARMPIR